MKISSSWLTVWRQRKLTNIKYREIERIHISDEGRIVIVEKVTPETEAQKLVIEDVSNEDLMGLYIQIQKVLFDKIK